MSLFGVSHPIVDVSSKVCADQQSLKSLTIEQIELLRSRYFDIANDVAYEQATIMLAKGDVLALYTDGITEAKADTGLFGFDRVQESISGHCSLMTAQNVTEALVSDSAGFAGGNIMDDVAVIVLKRL
ncbi:MAG TPA: SpoIIE family protein phosphatase [Candidatus Aquicultor sp.]